MWNKNVLYSIPAAVYFLHICELLKYYCIKAYSILLLSFLFFHRKVALKMKPVFVVHYIVALEVVTVVSDHYELLQLGYKVPEVAFQHSDTSALSFINIQGRAVFSCADCSWPYKQWSCCIHT